MNLLSNIDICVSYLGILEHFCTSGIRSIIKIKYMRDWSNEKKINKLLKQNLNNKTIQYLNKFKYLNLWNIKNTTNKKTRYDTTS